MGRLSLVIKVGLVYIEWFSLKKKNIRKSRVEKGSRGGRRRKGPQAKKYE